jgi:hypothetical protein
MLNYCQAREVAPMTPFVAAWAVVWCRNPAPVAIGFRAVGPPIIDAKAGQLSAGMGDSQITDRDQVTMAHFNHQPLSANAAGDRLRNPD